MRKAILGVMIGLALGSAAIAGNVTARVSGGNLYLYGDNSGSNISIDSPSSGQIRVSATPTASGETTTVNGQANGTVVLNGWTRGIYNYSYAGDDSLTLSSLLVNGHLHIDLGTGNDELFMGTTPEIQEMNALAATLGLDASAVAMDLDPSEGAVIIQYTLFVIGANGDDYVDLVQTLVGEGATFDLGQGSDEIFVGLADIEADFGVDFARNCVILPGTEADSVNLESVRVGHDLIVDDVNMGLDLYVFDVQVERSCFVYGTPSIDRIEMESIFVDNLFRVITEGDNDAIILSGSTRQLDLFSGLGNDRVRLIDFDSERLNVYLDPGEDDFLLQRGNTGRLYAYGSSGNDLFAIRDATVGQAYIYGDSGTDTYSGVPGNNIGSLNLYSIEIQ